MHKSLNRLSFFIKVFLTLLILLIIGFAIVSGSESFGGGIKGIIKNSPNAIPWLGLLIPVIIAWKYEKPGAIIITVLGLVVVYFFNTSPNFFMTTFIVTLTIPLCGIAPWLIAIRKEKLDAI